MLMVALCLVCVVGGCRSDQDGGREQLLSFKCAGLLESGGCASYALGVTDLVVRPGRICVRTPPGTGKNCARI